MKTHSERLAHRKTKLKQYAAKYRALHKPGESERARRFRETVLWPYSGWTKSRYQTALENQGGKCAICGDGGTLARDHCHITDTPRKLLCIKCNRSLGAFERSPAIMENASEYLRACVRTANSGCDFSLSA